MKIRLRYFAMFREQRGRPTEDVETQAHTVADLYRELGLALDPKIVRAAVNGGFVAMDTPLRDGDEVVFIPPVAGG